MIRNLNLLLFLLLTGFTANAQNMLEWSADHKLSVADFEAPAPNSGEVQTVLGSFSVSYEIGGLNLIVTRNLNNTVSCNFQKDASYIDKADEATTSRLLDYQQLIFNLYELQARNLRKKFFDEKKRLITNGPGELYQEVAAEHSKRIAQMESETFQGSGTDEIKRWNQLVLQELDELKEFCKECMPAKKRKNQ